MNTLLAAGMTYGRVFANIPRDLTSFTMPIYEFYCSDCHTIYNFLAHKTDTTTRPSCPRCGRADLDRKISRFAISKGRSEPGGEDDLPPGMDEAKMERVLAEMAGQADSIDEDDPRQMARMMRKMYDGMGMRMSEGMQEAMQRMEAGEDPDKIEEEMGDVFDEEEPLFGEEAGGRLKRFSRKLKPPEVDETLYEL